MPLPIILVGAVMIATSVYGAKKGIDAVSDIKEKNKVNKQAKDLFDKSLNSLKRKRSSANSALKKLGKQKLEIYESSILPFVDTFSKIKNLDFKDSQISGKNGVIVSKNEMKKFKSDILTFKNVIGGGSAALGSGGLVALATFGGTKALAVASTGTAISTLSGAAAKSATLAWLGGGTLATGGFGVAGGTVVLGGILAAPALAVGGMVFASRAKIAKEKAHENFSKAKMHAEEFKKAGVEVDAIKAITNELYAVLRELDSIFKPKLAELEKIVSKNTDYSSYSKKNKEAVFLCFATAKTLKNLLEFEILGKNGTVVQKASDTIQNAQKQISEL